MLGSLGIIPGFTQDFRTADGAIRSINVAYTWIQASRCDTVMFMAYNCEHNEPVMGRLAVNSLLLTVEPVE